MSAISTDLIKTRLVILISPITDHSFCKLECSSIKMP